MAVTIDIVDQDVFKALVVFFKTFLPVGTEIIQQQDNKVAMPKGGFVSMNNNGMERLSFNIDNYQSMTQGKTILTPIKFEVQLDFYGPTAQQWAAETVALFRDEYATEIFPSNIQPLYADDPVQLPLITGEEQYMQRWRLAGTLQYNPIFSTIQQSMIAAKIEIAPIDQTFTP
jgi:hypothetical protein